MDADKATRRALSLRPRKYQVEGVLEAAYLLTSPILMSL